MELFDTDFVWSGPVLSVSWMILLVTTNRYVGKTTIVPTQFSEHLLQNENKHQIMNVHIKWNCLIPILYSLVKYCLFHG